MRLGLAVIGTGVAIVGAFVAGLFVYVNATATPIHPKPTAIPSVARATPPPAWSAAVRQSEDAVRAGMTRQNLPGLSAAVGVGGTLVWAEGFGYADLEKKSTVTPDTQFRIGEVSNTLTSAAAGLLLESHKLDLDDEIQTYVPDFPRKRWPITLRELMAETSGMRNGTGDEEPLSDRCPRTSDGLKRITGASLLFEPGTRFRPSSFGWVLVSAAIESVVDDPFFTFMRRQIFEPLGLTHTRVDLWTDEVPDRATFYYPRFAGDTRYGPESVRDGDHSCDAGGGAFLSTPADLVRFGTAMERDTLLKRATVELLQTPQTLASGEPTGNGLGWALETVDLGHGPVRMAGHGTQKDFIGGAASLLTFPDRGVVVAVTTNESFADTKAIALDIARAFVHP